MRSSYSSYSFEVKQAIAQSKNPNLFPELRVPRSTAYHWIRHGVGRPKGDAAAGAAKNFKDSDHVECLSMLLKAFHVKPDLGHLSDDARLKLRIALKQKNFAHHLGPSLVQHLKNQLYRCPKSFDGTCAKRYPVKLTKVELERMQALYEGMTYAFMPVCSLALAARRDGVVNCSAQTWYRYAKMFAWQRPYRKVVKKRSKRRGIRATRPHEIWHVDNTVIKIGSTQRVYLQVILDNFSRFVVIWRLAWSVSRRSTMTLVKRARRKFAKDVAKLMLISDGGPENKNIIAGRIKPRVVIEHRLARHEIGQANTMVEVFFKTLKGDYLYHQLLKSFADAKKAIAYFVEQHNRRIPRVALHGRTPAEVLRIAQDEGGGEDVRRRADERAVQSERVAQRIDANRQTICYVCV